MYQSKKGQKIYYSAVASFTQEEETKEVKITCHIFIQVLNVQSAYSIEIIT